ncbi:MAG: hypothetical protein ACFB6R_15860 [Alphaproteobacteria bacterium]
MDRPTRFEDPVSDSRTTGEDPFFNAFAPIPRQIGLWLTLIVGSLFGGTLALALILAGEQRAPGTGQWFADAPQRFEGSLHSLPYPTLFHLDGNGQPTASVLMATGKRGVDARVRDVVGRRVAIMGFLVERNGQSAIEVADGAGAIEGLDGPPAAPPTVESLGPRTVRGEIIDSKCFLGVMKPGAGKTHKACATLCIIGGVPPQFVVRHGDGFTSALLVGPDGGPMPEDLLRSVADPVEVTGVLERMGPIFRLRVSAEDLKRL